MYFGGSFTYGSYNSENHKLMFARKDTAEMQTPVSSKTYSTMHNRANEKRYIYNSTYEEPLTFETEIFVCDTPLTETQSREVCRSLFNSNEYRWLKLKDSEWSGIHLNCVMKLDEKIYGGDGANEGVIGYKITISCDAPFAWKDMLVAHYVYAQNNEEITLTINHDTDYEKYTYPTVIITQTEELANIGGSTANQYGSLIRPPRPTSSELQEVSQTMLLWHKSTYVDSGDGSYFDPTSDVVVIGVDAVGNVFDVTLECMFFFITDGHADATIEIYDDINRSGYIKVMFNGEEIARYYITYQEEGEDN